MKRSLPFFLFCWLFLTGLLPAQNRPNLEHRLFDHNRAAYRHHPVTFNPDWAPFYHGVASGDPLGDRVIIWTRVTPENMSGDPIEVAWKVATDPDLQNVVQSGTFTTHPDRDYTVKVDVDGLNAGTTYYYGFEAMDKPSLTGRTKTTPAGAQAGHLKFGVVSCSNFQAGFFNAYQRLSERNDLDAIIHLGDYIYEYADGEYGNAELFDERPLMPETEIVSLADYRARYSTYRLDSSLARVHQQHPFIAVWDDHESANDAYVDGAGNHQPDTEGDWETRKAIARQVYFEWMPIRDHAENKVYRAVSYGDLMDLFMLDTRLEGREIQIFDISDSMVYAPDRTLLGEEQKAWLKDQLQNSVAQWKVIGQQVVFSELRVGWAALLDPGQTYESLESTFMDIWDGYPAERAELISFVQDEALGNVVILTGDVHVAYSFDVPLHPDTIILEEDPTYGTVPFYTPIPEYDPATGEGSLLVEFVTPSITSPNFDEVLDVISASIIESQINSNVNNPAGNLGNPNPHMKLVDLVNHGYFILDVKADSVQANYFQSAIDQIVEEESFFKAWYTRDGENHLNQAAAASAPKAVQDAPAPLFPPGSTSSTLQKDAMNLVVLGIYPNPFSVENTIHYALQGRTPVRISLFDAQGRLIQQLLDEVLSAGAYSLRVQGAGLKQGVYFYEILVGRERQSVPVFKVR